MHLSVAYGTMAEMTSTYVCLVLNAGGPTWPHKDAGLAWVERLLARGGPDLAFVQEVPSGAWLDVWARRGYRAILGLDRGWSVRSCLLTTLPADRLRALGEDQIAELRYHGSYVAAGRLLGTELGDLTLLSVHAQPAPAEDEYLSSYPRRDALRPRAGGDDPRHGGRLFDADVVLETISRRGPNVLACGDLNEARGWDDTHEGHTWGREFFGSVGEDGRLDGGRVQEAGLAWVPLSDDGAEVVTRQAPGHPSLQLDHVIAGPEVASRISGAEVRSGLEGDHEVSDHSPIAFRLDV